MAVKTFAAVSIGSTETEMRIYELSKARGMKQIECISTRLNLGADAYEDRSLDSGKIDRLCSVLKEFKEIMDAYKVDACEICATSALRELRSALITRDYIENRTGLKIRIISNSEQRFLDYESIASESDSFETIIGSGTAIVDIGGNSMQISVFDKDRLITTQNIPMGKLSTREKYYPVASNNRHFEALVMELLEHELGGFGKLYQKEREIRKLIVVDNDLLELVRSMGVKPEGNVYPVDQTQFDLLYDKVLNMSPEEIAQTYHISETAAELVPQSLIFGRGLGLKLGATTIWLMDVSLCDGLCYGYGVREKILKSSHDFESDIIAASRTIAKRYKSNQPHIRNVEELALEIFDKTKKVHGLEARERLLLQISAILHNCGKYISLTNVSDCAYNIIMATEIIGISHEERQIIANVVKYNTQRFEYYGTIASKSDVSQDDYLVISKLTAILRLANALDRAHSQKCAGASINVKDRDLVISIKTDKDLSLEKITVDEHKDFFEEVFNLHPVIHQKKVTGGAK